MAYFGSILAEQRRRHRLSQHELAALSGVSQRHISFLESGRAKPGKEALIKLVTAMMLTKPEIDRLLVGAGLLQAAAEFNWLSPAMGDVRHVIGLLLTKNLPFPALAYDRSGDVLLSNTALDALLRFADPAGDLSRMASNIYDLTLHPEGLPRFMVNRDEIFAHSMQRLRSAATLHPAASVTLKRILNLSENMHSVARTIYYPSTPVLHERYRLGDINIGLISVTSMFGSPENELAQQIQIESFFPADDATQTLLTSLC